MESREYLESEKGMVRFSELDACALVHGFSKNRFAIKQLKDVVGIEDLKALAYGLLRTAELKNGEIKIRPSEKKKENVKIIYSQIAEIELKRLAGGGETGFHCGHGHTLEQHKKSLEGVLSKLKPTIN